MQKGAMTVIECANVYPGERVLILTDTGIDFSVSPSIYQAALDAGAEPSIFMNEPRKYPAAPVEASVKAAMLASDVIICPTSTTMFYTEARQEANRNGKRVVCITQADPEILIRGPIKADFKKIRPLAEKLTGLLTKARTIRVTTPAGTDIKANIAGRQATANTGICDTPGCAQGVPDIEAYIPPIEDSSEGIIVVDGSTNLGLVNEPIRLKVVRGRVVEITGGEEAEALRRLLEGTDDPNAYTVAEFGIGLNPESQLRGVIMEDEGALGTVHMALGNNLAMGGENSADIHLDMVQRDPTIMLDGRVIMRGKEVLF